MNESNSQHPNPGSGSPKEPNYELRDANIKVLVMFGVTLFTVGVVVYFVAAVMLHYFEARPPRATHPPSPLLSERAPYTGPKLLVDQGADMAKFLVEEEGTLNSYGWVDKQQGIVRIPIDRAIQLVAEHGLPTFPTNVVSQVSGAKTTGGKTQK